VQLSCQAVRGWDELEREQTLTAAIMYRGVLGLRDPCGMADSCQHPPRYQSAIPAIASAISRREGQARGA
jgi:hypothetical protein